MFGNKPPVVNPCVKRPPLVPHNGNMGRQSQQRISNTKRKYLLASTKSFPKKKKGGQQTLFGASAFDSSVDCDLCKAQEIKKYRPEHRIPHRPHHELCVKNKATLGQGQITNQQREINKEQQHLQKLHSTPLADDEKARGKFVNKEACDRFFNPQQKEKRAPSTAPSPEATMEKESVNFRHAVSVLTADPSFCEKHKNKGAPLAMLAFATVAMKHVIHSKGPLNTKCFHGISMTVPPAEDGCVNPCCESTVGQKLLFVDWIRVYGINVSCPDANCHGSLFNE